MTSAFGDIIPQCLRREVVANVLSRTLHEAQTVLLQPAYDHWPVALQTVLIHRMNAFDRVSIIPAHDPGTAGRSIQGPPHGADARGAHVEPSDQVRLSFARGVFSVKLEVHDMDLGFASRAVELVP
jgi:hypothetical protein